MSLKIRMCHMCTLVARRFPRLTGPCHQGLEETGPTQMKELNEGTNIGLHLQKKHTTSTGTIKSLVICDRPIVCCSIPNAGTSDTFAAPMCAASRNFAANASREAMCNDTEPTHHIMVQHTAGQSTPMP